LESVLEALYNRAAVRDVGPMRESETVIGPSSSVAKEVGREKEPEENDGE
jgi:hypothetical protein